MPVAREDGLCRKHGRHSERIWQAVQLCSSNEGAGNAGLHGQRGHAPAQVCDVAVPVNAAKNVQLPQRILKSALLQVTWTCSSLLPHSWGHPMSCLEDCSPSHEQH